MHPNNNKILKAVKETNKEATASKSAAIKALQRADILTKGGKLAKPYRGLSFNK